MMHYLECIALLQYLLKKLHAGQRQQVPATITEDVLTNIIAINKKLEKESLPDITMRIRDVMASTNEIRETQGIMNLTDAMRNSLTSGITELQDAICLLAFEYYKVNDFEPTPQVIPVMRKVVQAALAKGVI